MRTLINGVRHKRSGQVRTLINGMRHKRSEQVRTLINGMRRQRDERIFRMKLITSSIKNRAHWLTERITVSMKKNCVY
jgi:hypothetical protein